MKKKPHGGARKGAGRKPKEPTVVIRVPVSENDRIKESYELGYQQGFEDAMSLVK